MRNWEWWFIILCSTIITLGIINMWANPAHAVTPQQHMRCLALNIYHEARDQSLEGQLGIGYTTINRVKSKRFPNNICQVVKQTRWVKKKNKRVAQFSWYSDGKPDTPREKLAWADAKRHALYVVTHPWDDVTNGATHYHATWIKAPYWAYSMVVTVWIQDHIYYKEE